MADGVSIQRDIEVLSSEIGRLKGEIKSTTPELNAINKALRLDPSNVELVNQKYDVFRKQLELNRERANALKNEIQLLNEGVRNGTYTTEQASGRIAELTKQQTLAEIEVTKLTGAINRQGQAVAKAQYGDITRSLHSMQTIMASTTTIMMVMGATQNKQLEENKERIQDLQRSLIDLKFAYDSGSITQEEYKNKTIQVRQEIANAKRAQDELAKNENLMQSMQKVMMGMQAVISISTLLQQMNGKSALSFQGLATSITLAVSGFTIASSLLNNFDGQVKNIISVITALTGVVVAGAVAWAAFHGAMSFGTAAPIIAAAIGVTTAAILSATSKAKSATADLSSTIGSIDSVGASYPTATPTMPSYSMGGQGGVTVQTLSEEQMRQAVYDGSSRALIELGMNNPQINFTQEFDGRTFYRFSTNALLDELSARGIVLR